MPELPEVETTCRGIAPVIAGTRISRVVIRNRQLRWPIPASLEREITGLKVTGVGRRGKYILISLSQGSLILHLGMSGSLRVTDAGTPPERHDHIDLVFSNRRVLRLRDPRRFGSVHWTRSDPLLHPLLAHLGPEPLGRGFNADYLYEKSRKRKQAVKTFIMDSRVVVGVGNIYANEALFAGGINPARAAGGISLERYRVLVRAIKQVLRKSIKKGGTTLRDFVSGEDRPGYFRQSLRVYERAGEPCWVCGAVIRQYRQGQRSTYCCPGCQK